MKKLLLLGLIAGLVSGFYFLGEQWLLPETYQALYQKDPVKTAGLFFIVYVLVAALSIPGAALMTLISGAIFYCLCLGGCAVNSWSGLDDAYFRGYFWFRPWLTDCFVC